MGARIVLAVIGAAYVAVAAWCALKPVSTAAAIGLELSGGSGRSEYFTVYGGLQTALGLIFLVPLVNASLTGPVLSGCVLIHAGLVLFRTLSLVMFSGVGSTTYAFAGLEWVLLLASGGAWWFWRG
jgi:hypothetical protein